MFYGWIVVGAAHLTLALCFGTAYAFSSFFLALQQEFAASRTAVSLAFSLAAFGYYLVGAFSGALAERVPVRLVVGAGVLLLCAGLVGASFVQSLPAVLLCYCCGFGLGVGLMYVPAVAAVSPWFLRHRGRAMGVAVTGTGVGTLCMPLLASQLVLLSDWRFAMQILAALVLLAGLPAAALLESSPHARGLLPDNETGDAPASECEGMTLGQAVRQAGFWKFYFAIFLGSVGVFIPYVHLAPYVSDLGMPPKQGALLVGLIGLGNIFGRFVLASWADHLGRRAALACFTVGMGLALSLWLGADSFWSFAAFSLAFGAMAGSCIALYPAVAADTFGTRRASSILGALYTAVGLAALAGPLMAAVTFDAGGSYAVSIAFAIACAGAAAALTWAGSARAGARQTFATKGELT